MARITNPLTNTEVKQAKPKDKEYNLADGNGLMLRVKPNGSKLWLFNYFRPFTKKRANLSFGSYPDLSLSDARLKRQASRELIAKDIDPKTQKEKEHTTKRKELNNTFEKIALAWFELYKKKVKEKTAFNTWSALENYILPHIGKKPIAEIEAFYVIEIIQLLAKSGKSEVVKKLCQKLNKIMTFAVNTGLTNANPLLGIKDAFSAPAVVNLPALKPQELPSLMKTITAANLKIQTRLLIEWQLHTMCRPGEAAGAMWQEIDLEKKLWNIPAERMKKSKPHTIPLSDYALSIMEKIKPFSHHKEYVFPNHVNSKDHINKEAVNNALKRMGYKNKLVAHGFRTIASSTLNEQGFDPDVIEAALSHVDKNEVRRTYNRTDYLERRRVMMAWWSDHIEQASLGNINNSKILKVVGIHE
ncbi:tyrosine-type recombinase/integrase [Colwellia sp. MB3u-70]|uniref:integrase domain-containing protein n=1 Tax=unclassified Colwellia TaxID=196834 RepID=UPI0015F765A2|nr:MULTISPECIES: integrase domain-containing protein [unclassified Colwellia]MBA6291623.1 tyrosine-type recombinase/integrase [Colwellia sp. MB3u-8]MBA6309198.1 tyrosine-type recombinase/integrase [Colwellia sp. MB3u-70]